MVTTLAAHVWWTGAVALSVTALALRSSGEWTWLVAVSGGAVAIALPLPIPSRQARVWWTATLAGVGLFGLTRGLWASTSPATRIAIAASVVAAVGEEALFRRGLYGLLERWGALVAVLGSALVFGLVHVPLYGWRVLALDVGAGLIFGWQRWATGSWTAPALTHALANVMVHV